MTIRGHLDGEDDHHRLLYDTAINKHGLKRPARLKGSNQVPLTPREPFTLAGLYARLVRWIAVNDQARIPQLHP